MTVVVRPAVPGDADRVAEIHVAGYEEAYRGKMPDEVIDARTIEVRRRLWRERLPEDREREFVLVAELDGEVVGFVSGRPATADEVEVPDPAIGCWENMYSDPAVIGDARGFRVALEMHRGVEAAFAAHGYREAVCFVLEGNDRAARFFELVGWKRDGLSREVDGALLHRLRRTFRPPVPVGSPMESSNQGGSR